MKRWGIFKAGALTATVLHPTEPTSEDIGVDLTDCTVTELVRVPDPRFETASASGVIAVDIEAAARSFEAIVDAAFEARLAIIGNPEMKQRMHRRKEAEARSVVGPETTGVPMLEAEASETGTDIVSLAAQIIERADAAIANDAEREAARRKAKLAVRAADNPASMESIVNLFRNEVSQWN